MDFIEKLGPMALGTRIKNLAELMMKDVARVYKDHGIDFEPRWFTLFQLVLEEKEISVTGIAKELNQTHPAVVQVLNMLEKKKLIASVKDEADHRRRLVRLTPKGKALASELSPVWTDIRMASEEILNESVPDLIEKIAQVERVIHEKSTYQRIMEKRTERMLSEIEFIPFHKKYIHDFRLLNEDWLKSYLDVSDHDRQMLQDPYKEIINKDGQIMMMTSGKMIIGSYALKRVNEKECELSKFTIHKDFRGLGLGDKLLEHAIRMAETHEFNAILLFTHHKLKEATKLYYKHGFKDLTEHPGYKDETGRCSMMMKRNIN